MPEDAGKGVFHFQSEVTLRLTTGVRIIAYAQAGAQGDCEGGVLESGLGGSVELDQLDSVDDGPQYRERSSNTHATEVGDTGTVSHIPPSHRAESHHRERTHDRPKP